MKRDQGVAIAIIGAIVLVGIIAVSFAARKMSSFLGADEKFGDQHLKTAVALVELHKIRYGRYPNALSDLRFVGEWDGIALNSVSYHANDAGTRYCIEVERGWIGKPRLQMPAEFWRGTGYDPSLCRQ